MLSIEGKRCFGIADRLTAAGDDDITSPPVWGKGGRRKLAGQVTATTSQSHQGLDLA